MKKTAIATVVALSIGAGAAYAAPTPWSGAFCMYSPTGSAVSDGTWGTACDEQVSGTIDTTTHTFTLSSPQQFFGVNWVAHDGVTYGPGTYSIQTIQGGTYTGIKVGPGQVGGHVLFDYGPTLDIDVFMVWDVTSGPNGNKYSSTDVTDGAGINTGATDPTGPDGTPGLKMIDGSFAGFSANFNMSTATPPQANTDNSRAKAASASTINAFANDIDSEGNMPPASYTVNLIGGTGGTGGTGTGATFVTTAGATVTNVGDGTFTYDPTTESSTPAGGSTDSFSYRYTDTTSGLTTTAATVNITIGTSNLTATNNVTFSTSEDTAKTVNILDLDDSSTPIATDNNPSNLKFDIIRATTPNGGTVTGSGTTSLTYTPAANYNGTDTIKFTVTNGTDQSASTQTMTVNVAAVNDPPVCPDVNLGTPTDKALSISEASDLLIGCTDVEGDTVTVDSVTQPTQSGATLADNGAGTLTYTPPPGYTGPDSFQVTATDGNGGFVTFTVNLTVGQLQSNFTMLDKSGNVFGGSNDVDFTWDGNYNTDETDVNFSHMSIATSGPTPFFGAIWYAHDIQVFGPGTYYFETDNTKCESKTDADPNNTKTYHSSAADIAVSGCKGTPGGATTMTLVVGTGQVGAHMLFDYNGSFDIDVINVWNQNDVWNDPTGQGDSLNDLWTGAGGTPPSVTTTWALVSTDADGDGIIGAPMVDGPFIGFSANFNKDPGGAGTRPTITETAPITLNHNFLGSFSWQTLLLAPAGLLMLRRRRKH